MLAMTAAAPDPATAQADGWGAADPVMLQLDRGVDPSTSAARAGGSAPAGGSVCDTAGASIAGEILCTIAGPRITGVGLEDVEEELQAAAATPTAGETVEAILLGR